jgi:hypothetical protein
MDLQADKSRAETACRRGDPQRKSLKERFNAEKDGEEKSRQQSTTDT